MQQRPEGELSGFCFFDDTDAGYIGTVCYETNVFDVQLDPFRKRNIRNVSSKNRIEPVESG